MGGKRTFPQDNPDEGASENASTAMRAVPTRSSYFGTLNVVALSQAGTSFSPLGVLPTG
jgi:hypothetical protein